MWLFIYLFSDTLTDVSSFVGDSDSLMTKSFSGEKVQERYQDFDDFDGFKLPDLSVSIFNIKPFSAGTVSSISCCLMTIPALKELKTYNGPRSIT